MKNPLSLILVVLLFTMICPTPAETHPTENDNIQRKKKKTFSDTVKYENWKRSRVTVTTVPEGVAVKTMDTITKEMRDAGLTPAGIEWYHHCENCSVPSPVSPIILEYLGHQVRVIPVDGGNKKIFIAEADFSKGEPRVIKGITYNDTVYSATEKMPGYPKGEDAMYNFIFRYLDYPQYAQKNGIEGTVYVSFIVEQDGSLTTVKILRGIGGGCDEAVTDVIKLMPRWYPGKHNELPVRTRILMPFKFIRDKKSNLKSVYYYR